MSRFASNPTLASAPSARAIIIFAIFAALCPLVRCDFGGFDDALNLTHNPHLNPPTWRGVAHYWRKPEFDLYVPVTYTLWSALARLAYLQQPDPSGVHLNPLLFHLTNLLLHVGSALVVFEILRHIFGNIPAATLGALLFALHPLQVEPVAWAAGMKDVLAAMLALVALWQYVLLVQEDRARRRRAHWIVGTLAFVLAMLSKPGVVVLPALAWMIDVMLISRDLRRASMRLLPWFVLAIPCIILTRLFQPSAAVGDSIAFRFRPFIATDALAFYLYKLVLPLRLGVDYGRTPQIAIEKGWIWITWVVPVALGISAWLVRRWAPALTAAIIIFVVALLPVLGLVPFDFQAYSTVADHYMYLPMLGAALAAAWVVTQQPTKITRSVILFLVIVAGILSWNQTRHWRDAQAIFSQALRVNPQSWVAHTRLAEYYSSRAQYVAALRHAEHAVAANPRAWPAHTTLAQILAQLGRNDQAIDSYRAALKLNPNDLLANANLANLLADQGKLEEAIGYYRAALKLNPLSVILHTNLAGALEEAGNLDAAADVYRKALEMDARSVAAQMGLARIAQRKSPASAPTSAPF